MNPILVVDDNEQILNILSQYIKKENWPFVTAKTGENALKLFKMLYENFTEISDKLLEE